MLSAGVRLHVSFERWGASPPKSTTRPAGSLAAEAKCRDGGLMAGVTWVQVLPSQVHVSPMLPVEKLKPPNSTTAALAASVSVARVAAKRAGGWMAGLCWLQVVPSHVQVSPSALPVASKPPKSTTRRLLGSAVMAATSRPGGPVVGV